MLRAPLRAGQGLLQLPRPAFACALLPPRARGAPAVLHGPRAMATGAGAAPRHTNRLAQEQRCGALRLGALGSHWAVCRGPGRLGPRRRLARGRPAATSPPPLAPGPAAPASLLAAPTTRVPRPSRNRPSPTGQPLPAAARPQPGGMVSMGRGGLRGGARPGQAHLPVGRLLDMPLGGHHGWGRRVWGRGWARRPRGGLVGRSRGAGRPLVGALLWPQSLAERACAARARAQANPPKLNGAPYTSYPPLSGALRRGAPKQLLPRA
jgi:hypothetical protein